MKLRVTILLMLLVFGRAYGKGSDTCRGDANQVFHRAIWSYVATVLPKQYANGKFNVFVVRFYHVDKDKKDISFTLGNIISEYDYDNLRPDHYFYLGKEVFLVEMDDESILQQLDSFEIHKLNVQWPAPYGQLLSIMQRLRPQRAGVINRHSIYGEMYTIRNKCHLQRRYAGDDSQIPDEYSVFHTALKGKPMDIDE